jgi:lipid II:glycine glycyltransferase (peptidoglycan interpeptide bridge formation enzyme)
LEYLSDLEAVYSNFQSNIRTDIKKAEKILQIKEDLQIEDFYKINTKTFERQGECIRYSLDFLKVLDEACLKNNCRKIFYAIDDENNIHAAIYIIWDENSAYYLMSGSDPVLRHSGANSLLLWHAIQFASRVTKKFDFEGSMIENIERFFRAFGTNQKQYFNISKDFKKSNVYKVIIKDIYSSSPVIKKLYSRLRRGRK